MDIITEFTKSPEMREHLKKTSLNSRILSEIVINAPESLEKKKVALEQLFKKCAGKVEAVLPHRHILAIQAALDNLTAAPGEVFNLIECWYDDEMLCEKTSSGIPFTSFEAALTYLRKLIAEEEWNDDTTCWTIIEKWVPAEGGHMERTYDYILIKDTIVDFRCYNTDTNEIIGGRPFRISSRDPLDVNLNLPIPFKPGDIVALDCRPFAPVKPALLLAVSDDCCGVQMLFEHDGMLNMDIYDTAALKHGHGYKDAWDHEYLHPLSYLYNLRRINVPDDFVNISWEWDEKQFRAILPFMKQVIEDNLCPEVPEDVLRRFYLAKYQILRQTGEAGR